MAPLLRHTVGRSFGNDLQSPQSITTLVSRCGADHADRSFLLIRERSVRDAGGNRLILRGIFDQSLHARLQNALTNVSRSGTLLTIDLRDVTYLDESCLRLLQRTQRSHSRIAFLLPILGPVAAMLGSLSPMPKALPIQRSVVPVTLGSQPSNERLYASLDNREK